MHCLDREYEVILSEVECIVQLTSGYMTCKLHSLLAPAYFFASMCMSVARAIVAAHAGRSLMRLVYAATAGQSARSTCAGAMLGH